MNTSEFVTPMFYFTDDVYSFDSLEALLSFIEPWDVESTDRGFDAEGRRVVLDGGAVVRRRFSVSGGQTTLNSHESGERAAPELRELLTQYVRSSRAQELDLDLRAIEALSLDALVATVHPVTRHR